MRVTDNDVREAWQKLTARAEPEAGDCLSEDDLLAVASAPLAGSDRQRVVDHVARCSDCAREYQIARALRPPEARPSYRMTWLALAAAAIIAFVMGGLIQSGRRTIDRLAREGLSASAETKRLREQVADLSRPQIGVSIVDLDADVVRGAASARVSVPPNAITLIVHLPGELTHDALQVQIEQRDGTVMWRDDSPPRPNGTVSIALNRGFVSPGDYSIRVRSASSERLYPFTVE